MNYRKNVEEFCRSLIDELYSVRKGKGILKQAGLDYQDLLRDVLEDIPVQWENTSEIIIPNFESFINKLKNKLDKDIEALYQGDPAAVSKEEIIIAYPGFYALANYRIANFLLNQGVPLLPRVITEYAHTCTGIDIHPGATLGEYICIDHGSGVVIGETAIIGNHVKIYQGVTLGALSIEKKSIPGKRHPTIEDHVIIYAQATILGGDTTIGHHSVIGGNVWLTKSVPPHSKIYYQSIQNIKK